MVKFIRDLTGIPHNGCTFPSKKRKRKRRSLKRKFFLKEYYLLKKNVIDPFIFKIEKKSRRRFKKANKFLKYIRRLPTKR